MLHPDSVSVPLPFGAHVVRVIVVALRESLDFRFRIGERFSASACRKEALFRYLHSTLFEAFNKIIKKPLIQGILLLAGKALPSRVVVTHNRSSNSCYPRLESAAGIETLNPD